VLGLTGEAGPQRPVAAKTVTYATGLLVALPLLAIGCSVDSNGTTLLDTGFRRAECGYDMFHPDKSGRVEICFIVEGQGPAGLAVTPPLSFESRAAWRKGATTTHGEFNDAPSSVFTCGLEPGDYSMAVSLPENQVVKHRIRADVHP